MAYAGGDGEEEGSACGHSGRVESAAKPTRLAAQPTSLLTAVPPPSPPIQTTLNCPTSSTD
ncbi:hypothetical protein BDK51DRAFT_39750 [Blyttiomyces helicus]|uniref:Uncharacterized protein n=1 Tax=Blyttiomyces helicus TaxID=388810 RepID=A0A4P9WBL0_9FUNG|nr:hypothetical protein BDK51DRAFT_39750 [Blyttiomyces helicus]|eukprot:RKO88943.1 hypothetical protein BDK51DRAFT_39750 [Blyttiomyces helicus]